MDPLFSGKPARKRTGTSKKGQTTVAQLTLSPHRSTLISPLLPPTQPANNIHLSPYKRNQTAGFASANEGGIYTICRAISSSHNRASLLAIYRHQVSRCARHINPRSYNYAIGKRGHRLALPDLQFRLIIEDRGARVPMVMSSLMLTSVVRHTNHIPIVECLANGYMKSPRRRAG